MSRSLFFSFFLHAFFIYLTALTLPFMLRNPVDLPPIVSVEFIEIRDKTNLPYAPKARQIIEKVKKEKERVVSEQAPPADIAKEKPDRIPMPEDKKEKQELKKRNKIQKKLNLKSDKFQSLKKKNYLTLIKLQL